MKSLVYAIVGLLFCLPGPVTIWAAATPDTSAPRATARSAAGSGVATTSGADTPRASVRGLAPEARRILGRWAIIPWSKRDDADVRPDGYLEFKEDLRCVLTIASDTLSQNTYTVDTSREPWWVDIDIVRPADRRRMLGVLEWIDENTAKFNMQWDEGGIVKHPTGFSSSPDIVMLRRLSDDGTVEVDPSVAQVVGTWDVVAWANRSEERYKGHTMWRLGADKSFDQKGSVLWNSDASGSYTLNTLKRPCWLDVTVSGQRIMGLVEYLGSALKVEMFPHPLSDEHPAQFSDVEYGRDVIGVDRNIFYLTPKKDSPTSTNTASSLAPQVTAGAVTVQQEDYAAPLIPVPVYDVATFKNLIGYIDTKGTFVVEPRFEYGGEFHDGMSLVKLGGKYGFIDSTGHLAVEPVYDDAWHFQEDLGIVEVNGKRGYINKAGAIVISAVYDLAQYFKEGMAWVKQGEKFGYIDTTGRVVVPPTFDSAGDFSEGLAWFELEGKYGFIDKSGRPVIPQAFDEARDFSEGLAAVHLSGTATGGSWGYIDKTGKFAIEPIFVGGWMCITDFSGGFALAQWDDPAQNRRSYWVVINQKGDIVKNTTLRTNPVVKTNGFKEGLAVFSYVGGGKQGPVSGEGFVGGAIVDRDGNLTKPVFDIPNPSTGFDVSDPAEMRDFREGLAAVKIHTKWSYVDPKGKLWQSPVHDRVGDFGYYAKGITWLETNGSFIYCTKSGQVIFDGSKQVWDSKQQKMVAR